MYLTTDLSHGGYLELYDETGELLVRAVDDDRNPSIPFPEHSDQRDGFDPEELHVQAVRQTDDGFVPYPGSDANLTLDVSDIEWATETPSPTATPEPTPTATPITHPTPAGSPTPTPDVSVDDGGPGFIPVIAVLALLAVVLATRRHRQ